MEKIQIFNDERKRPTKGPGLPGIGAIGGNHAPSGCPVSSSANSPKTDT